MEILLHYVWKHRLFPLRPLETIDHRPVEVIDTGLHNRNAGPDFFNAKVKIGDTLWVGNVEIHDRASDWFLHGHDHDAAYNNVVLHVVGRDDGEATTQEGVHPPQMVLEVPRDVEEHYEELLRTDTYPPCYQIIPKLSTLTVHSWMSRLQTERLEQKTEAIRHRVEDAGGSWEQAYFVTLARNYGFGVNGAAFEQWAQNVPLLQVDHHRDDLFQVETIFMGQAGLLQLDTIPMRHRAAALQDAYYSRMVQEYNYLSHKFGLRPIDHKLWRWLRLRPQNFPHIRISQLANLYFMRRAGLSALIECSDLKAVEALMQTTVSPYWKTHYTFGAESKEADKALSRLSTHLIIINTVVPMLFAYGRHKRRDDLEDRAFDFLEQLKAEQNHIVTMWKKCGLEVRTAGDSQALIQLKNEYCDRRECLRCRIGYQYIAQTHSLCHEPEE